MQTNTFIYEKRDVDGKPFHILTAQEYPWLNVQVVTFAPSDHNDAIAKLKAQKTIGWVIEHPDRRDFAVIHAGGSGQLQFTQENHRQIIADMKQCLRNAAEWWAKIHPFIAQ